MRGQLASMCMHPRRSHMHAVARKLLFRLFCYPANGIRPSVIFKCDAPPECPGRVYVPYFNFDCFFRYFLSPFTPHPSRQNLIFFFCSHDKDREGEKERGRERRRQAARWSTVPPPPPPASPPRPPRLSQRATRTCRPRRRFRPRSPPGQPPRPPHPRRSQPATERRPDALPDTSLLWVSHLLVRHSSQQLPFPSIQLVLVGSP